MTSTSEFKGPDRLGRCKWIASPLCIIIAARKVNFKVVGLPATDGKNFSTGDCKNEPTGDVAWTFVAGLFGTGP
jgi:hypothetical protein